MVHSIRSATSANTHIPCHRGNGDRVPAGSARGHFSRDRCRRSLLDKPAFGPFFRPMYEEWLTSFHVLKGWKWYQHCRGKGSNLHASSRTSYFGFDALSFAARCSFSHF